MLNMPSENSIAAKILVYFDHSVLDRLEKSGSAIKLREVIPYNWLPVYSDETLREIVRSPDYESSFCQVLEDLGAAHIALDLFTSTEACECTIKYEDPILMLAALRESPAINSFGSPMAGFWQFSQNPMATSRITVFQMCSLQSTRTSRIHSIRH